MDTAEHDARLKQITFLWSLADNWHSVNTKISTLLMAANVGGALAFESMVRSREHLASVKPIYAFILGAALAGLTILLAYRHLDGVRAEFESTAISGFNDASMAKLLASRISRTKLVRSIGDWIMFALHTASGVTFLYAVGFITGGLDFLFNNPWPK